MRVLISQVQKIQKVVTTLKKLDRPQPPAWHARFVRKNTTSKQIENQKPLQRYKRARFYSAQLGRFISRDPLGFEDGYSLYRAYFVPVGNDPMGEKVFDDLNDPLKPLLGLQNLRFVPH